MGRAASLMGEKKEAPLMSSIKIDDESSIRLLRYALVQPADFSLLAEDGSFSVGVGFRGNNPTVYFAKEVLGEKFLHAIQTSDGPIQDFYQGEMSIVASGSKRGGINVIRIDEKPGISHDLEVRVMQEIIDATNAQFFDSPVILSIYGKEPRTLGFYYPDAKEFWPADGGPRVSWAALQRVQGLEPVKSPV